MLDDAEKEETPSKSGTKLASIQASLGSLGQTSTTASGSKKKPKPAAKKRSFNQVDEPDDKSASLGGAALQGLEASEFLFQLQKTDPEMAQVCAKHEAIKKATAPCLAKLSVVDFLNGNRWGQALNGVWCYQNLAC